VLVTGEFIAPRRIECEAAKVTWTERLRTLPRSALFRALRVGIVAPGTFALADKVFGNPTAALFAALGSISMLLFAEFGGSNARRTKSHLALVGPGAVLVTIGTACSQNLWLATAVTLVLTFLILFAGIVSSVLAGAQSAMLIAILLPVTLPGPVDSIPSRLLGWLLAGAASLLAILLLPPRKSGEPLPRLVRDACRELGGRLRSMSSLDADDTSSSATTAATSALKTAFLSAPYRPAGLSRSARSVAQIAEQLILLQNTLKQAQPLTSAEEREAMDIAGQSLQASAELLAVARPDPLEVSGWRPRLKRAHDVANQAVVDAFTSSEGTRAGRAGLVAQLEPSFLVREVTLIVDAIIEQTEACAVARSRTWWEHLIDLSPVSSAKDRLSAHLNWNSVWLHNSIRGAVGFGLTVFLADILGVQHAFWVVFGTLAILRSNAVNTGQTAVRALIGTAIGLAIGLPIVLIIGDHTAISWILLPLVFAFTVLASVISFAAGQAGFTFNLLLLFSIVGPVGVDLGLIRIGDVALGCGVAVIVTLLLWPRGATANVNRALANAFDQSANYLGEAVRYALLRGHASLTGSPPESEAVDATNAARLLDDATRQFLAERGAKSVDLAELTSLVVAVAVLRRSGDEICKIWERNDDPPPIAQTGARAEILLSQAELVGWYRQAAAALRHNAPLPGPLATADTSGSRVLDALRPDFRDGDRQQALAAVKLLWTEDQLGAARRVGTDILPALSSATEAGARRSAWFVGSRARARARAGVRTA
jgi:uncharacterized membrane protein YccC